MKGIKGCVYYITKQCARELKKVSLSFERIKDFDNNFITSLELCYNYDPVKLKHHDICQNSTCNKQRLSLERSIFQNSGMNIFELNVFPSTCVFF